MLSTPPRFRTDINGLRAVAVLAVVFFHFGVGTFQGGFVGVDVFFVISGYLMTRIIFERLETNRFSTIDFYLDRARRIVPALGFLCVALLCVGWFTLLPSEYKTLAKHSASSIAFVSNIIFWREAGYFNPVSTENWLLHTWSLSVEWQFYLLYPLVVVVLRKLVRAAHLRWCLGALAVGSFALSVHGSIHSPTGAFFLLPTRAWELLAGGLVYLFPIACAESARSRLAAVGLVLIFVSIFTVQPTDRWPGWLAAIPVAGTALVIAARHDSSWLLGNRVAGFVGKTSYSIYLWHWPVVVAITNLGKAGEWVWISGGIATSLLLGFLSYRFIEPCGAWLDRRRGASRERSRLPALSRFVLVGVVIGTASSLIWFVHGVPARYSPAVQMADNEAASGAAEFSGCFVTFGEPAPPCVVGGSERPSGVILIGDSHAGSVASALAESVAAQGRGSLLFQGYASCPTLAQAAYPNTDNKCFEFNERYLKPLMTASPQREPVVVVNFWSNYLALKRIQFLASGDDGVVEPFSIEGYRTHFLATMCALASARPVFLTLPIPEFAFNVPKTVARRLIDDADAPDVTVGIADYRQRNAVVLQVMEEAAHKCGVKLLDPTPFLCKGGQCMGSLSGRPLYSDSHHLSAYGSRLLIPMFSQIFEPSSASDRS